MSHGQAGFWAQLFEYRGRIGRLKYFWTSIGLSCFYGVCYALIDAMAGHDGKATEAVLFIVMSIVWTMAAIKRSHDFDASGRWSVLLWVPLANFVWQLNLLLRRGTDGPNRFGDGKMPQGTGHAEPTWAGVEATPLQPVTEAARLPKPAPAPRKKFWGFVGVVGAGAGVLLIKVLAVGVGSAAGSAAGHAAYNDSQREDKIQTSLIAVMNQMNKNAPVMVDKVTRLDNVNGMGRQLTYSYTLVGYKVSDINVGELRKYMQPRAFNFVCTGDTMKVFVGNNIPVTYVYRDDLGAEIMRLRFSASDCKSGVATAGVN